MNQHHYNNQTKVSSLVAEYEAMSQRGVVAFYEEAVFCKIIDYYENEYELDTALEVVELAITQHPYSSRLFCRQALILAVQKNTEDALFAIEKAEALAPGNWDVQLIRAEVLALLDMQYEALAITNSFKENDMQDKWQEAEVHFTEGVIYEYMSDYENAFRAWKQTLTLMPFHEEALSRIWACVEISRNFEDSIKLCHQIINENPYCYQAWYNLGHAYTYFGDYNAAIDAYEYAFIVNPSYEWAYRHYAERCIELKQFHKALEAYRELMGHSEPDGEILFKVGQCYHYLGKSDIARQFYQQSVQYDSINDEAYYYLGVCSVELEEWQQAIRYFRKAISLDNKQEDYFSGLGEVYARINKPSRARYYFNRAIRLSPQDDNHWIKLVQYLIENKAYSDAIEVLKEAEEHTFSASMLYHKVICLFGLGLEEQAFYHLQEALEEDYELHPVIFKYHPELVKHRKLTAMLDYFKYHSNEF